MLPISTLHSATLDVTYPSSNSQAEQQLRPSSIPLVWRGPFPQERQCTRHMLPTYQSRLYVMGYEIGTYSVSKSENFISLFELASGFPELGDHSGEFDTHDSLGSLWG
jgi:hypothetical protein